MKKILLFSAVFVCIGLVSLMQVKADTSKTMRAELERGQLDLREVEHYEKSDFALQGPWEFYWKQLLRPKDFSDETKGDGSYIFVPEIWSNVTVEGKRLDDQGYGTYRLLVWLNEKQADDEWGLYVPSIATSYVLWINGERIAENGKVGTSVSEMVPVSYAKTVYFQPRSGKNEIVIQVANFSQRKGGLWKGLTLGTAERIVFKRDQNVFVQTLFVGILLIMGLYHLWLYLLRRSLKSMLFFGTCCLLIAVRALLLEDILLGYFLPTFSWEIMTKIEYLTTVLGLLTFVYYVGEIYPLQMKRKFKRFCLYMSLPQVLLILSTPARIFTEILPYLSIYILIVFGFVLYVFFRAALYDFKEAKLNALAASVFVLAVVNDLLYYNQLIKTGSYISEGFVFFLSAQAFVLAKRFTRLMEDVEKLTGRLRKVNVELELKVRARTKELEASKCSLEESNRHLHKLQESRNRLLSDITHELKNPMMSIRGYTEAIMDGTVQPDQRYVQIINRKAELAERLIQDLSELSQLECQHVSFDKQTMTLGKLYDHLHSRFHQPLGSKKTFDLRWRHHIDSDASFVEVDLDRMEQVFVNVLNNAIKFIPSQGRIDVSFRTLDEKEASYWKKFVSDSLSVETNNGWLWVGITDNGVGIYKEDLPYVFERFYRGSNGKNNETEGTGLGLAISREIVRQHGGLIGVKSKRKKGSTFFFMLPLKRS